MPPSAVTEPQRTVRVRGRAHIPPGIGSSSYRDSTGTLREDPGRLRADIWWPRERYVEHDVTLAQLEQLLADGYLEIRNDKGDLLSPPKVDETPTPEETLRAAHMRIVHLEGVVRSLEHKVLDVQSIASRDARSAVARIRDAYQARVHELENDLKAANLPVKQTWLPTDLAEFMRGDED